MDNQSGHVMTLANSIIGVSILAMPYCFKQCGIVLSVIMLLISSVISRLACHFLLKSAIIARRKTFEYLAFHIFGSLGKLAIEIGIIGFLLGTCIAFFVVMGDLGPEIVAEMTGIYTTNTMRTSILMALALFCVFPLGLLRNVDSLNGVSKATIAFYCSLVLKIVFEAIPHLFTGDWYGNVVFWRPAGILQCLPIFSMALFCQTQLFEIYQALQNATLDKMNNVVRVAVNICTWVYIFVGIFGYIAFSHKQFTGNILLSFSPSLMTDIMKIGFVLSVAFSFPLVIFPCRASLYSLLYKEGYSLHEGISNYIPEGKFKGLTMFIVFLSLIIGIMIPNIELVLGLVGSTIGVMICVLFPVACFICVSPRNTNERILAQLMLMVGVFVMVLGTYKNLYTLDTRLEPNTVTISSIKNLDQLDLNVIKAVNKAEGSKDGTEKLTTIKIINSEDIVNKAVQAKVDVTTLKEVEVLKEVRHEPPQPIEPQEEVEEHKVVVPDKKDISLPPENKETANKELEKTEKVVDKIKDVANDESKSKVVHKNDEVDMEAIKKEDREVELQANEKVKADNTNQVLIDTIQKQNEVQKEIVEQQKKLIEVIQSQQKNAEASDIHKVHAEKVKAMKQIESIALEAIEKIGGGKEGQKLAADLQAKVEETVNQKKESNENKPEPLQDQNQNAETDIKSEENKNGVIKIDVEPSNNESKKPDSVNLAENSLVNQSPQENKAPLVQSENKSHVEKTHEADIENSQIKDSNKKETVDNLTVDAKLDHKNDQGNLEPNSMKQNIVEQNKIENINLVNSNVPEANNNNVNNTAPLFLKLGKAEEKPADADVKQMLPLPIIISNSLLKGTNSSKAEDSADNKIIAKSNVKNELPVNNDELQFIRRDILMVTNRRKR